MFTDKWLVYTPNYWACDCGWRRLLLGGSWSMLLQEFFDIRCSEIASVLSVMIGWVSQIVTVAKWLTLCMRSREPDIPYMKRGQVTRFILESSLFVSIVCQTYNHKHDPTSPCLKNSLFPFQWPAFVSSFPTWPIKFRIINVKKIDGHGNTVCHKEVLCDMFTIDLVVMHSFILMQDLLYVESWRMLWDAWLGKQQV